MFRYFLISALLLFWAECGFAQSNFQKGYIVKTEGDTLFCYIDYQDWSDSPAEVYFKRDLTQKEERLTALSSKGFYIEGKNEHYESHLLNLLYVGIEVYESRPDHYFQQTLFLEKLWSNTTISLYYGQSDKDGKPRFFIKDSTSFYELLNYSYYKEVNGQNYLVKIEEYKKQLSQLTSDAAGFSMPIPPYAERYLIKYLQAYHEKRTGGQSVKFRKEDERSSFYVGLSAGSERLNITNIRQKENNLSLGLALRINFPRNHQNTFIKTAFYVTPKMMIFDELNQKQGAGRVNNLELVAGQYIGSGKIQPFYSLGMTYFETPVKSFGFITPTIGIAYKKQMELEIAHFSPLFFQIQDETPSLIPTRITFNYFFKAR
ncbi:hypothetical protein [Siphonobacter sp. SORGH_AS_1065]|uniref:hypothetical protein n=1 Tax=Siphonobacter sp. SORGH_AS_1065 TaxID=3041795 RepID=UPI0027803F61|nr:hypothetical protein [Siphonobacter sp. SORGH_AS_1065]MDQ1086509.1 hypothetical protein [Siphonobacter sp. SORGH_AS_1065]